MYDGETKKVTLVCKNDLMNYIVDRFGDEVDTVPGDCGHFRAVAEVSVSQSFFAWVFQFNGDIRITAPEEVVLQYGEMLKNALQTYVRQHLFGGKTFTRIAEDEGKSIKTVQESYIAAIKKMKKILKTPSNLDS